jgi:hypothetical protein
MHEQTSTLDTLRAEFPPVDLLYVRRHHPRAEHQARRYNAVRAAIDPQYPATIDRARRVKKLMMKRIEA